jgi:uncharacterized protein (TIGR03118 family)
MIPCFRTIAYAAALAACLGPAWSETAAPGDNSPSARNAYARTDLVSNGAVPAATSDPKLLNAWGVAFIPGGPFWIADNGSGLSTLYDGAGAKQALEVTIPAPGGAAQGPSATPTGLVWNPTSQFQLPGSNGLAAVFIFATEDGTIAGWNPGLPDRTRAVLAVDNSQGGDGAVYKGLAMGTNAKGNFLYATNFRSGAIDVFDSNFAPATLGGSFTDPDLPAGYAPFGIRNIDGDLLVTFAVQDDDKHDDVAGPGNGIVDVFDTDGQLVRRFATFGPLNSPWGIARAPFAFGRFSGAILIGDFGDGRINAYDMDGNFQEHLQDESGRPIEIDGLWTLTFGGAAKSDPDTLYFTAGPNGEQDGLFGAIAPVDRTPLRREREREKSGPAQTARAEGRSE